MGWSGLGLAALAVVGGCTPSGLTITPPGPDETDAPRDTQPPGDSDVFEPDTEDLDGPDVVMDGSLVFDEQEVHSVGLELTDQELRDLRVAPREWTTGTLVFRDRSYDVGLRLKGNTVFQTMDGKPAFKIDMNRTVEGQDLYGLPSFYLHNFVLDPTRMHERISYGAFRAAGAPAARTAYATVTVNDEPYGIYLIVEKQNATFLEQWWDDASGSVYESGSFNWPCDLNSGSMDNPCRCFEVDREGEGDSAADLQELCRAVRAPDATWLEALEPFVDMEAFVQAQAMEIAMSHFDNYGWNKNNFRIYHEPTTGRWHWTPWSADLSFGWYPWDATPECGEYGQRPEDYANGYLMQRCWVVEDCKTQLLDAVLRAADELERQDVLGELDRIDELIAPYIEEDLRNPYDSFWYERELSCARTWLAQRPTALRQMVAALQEP